MRSPIESKVKWSTAATTVVAVALAFAQWLADNPDQAGGLPPQVQALLVAIVPPLVTFTAGYLAPHTPRSLPAHRLPNSRPSDSPPSR